MKEQDVRQRIEGFLKRTARELIIPASVGLSLGLSGCGSDAVSEYGAQFPPPDAGTYADVPTYAPMYAGSFPPGVHAGSCSGTWSEGDFLEPPDASADGDEGGTMPCCGDGIMDQGEQCDVGTLNGMCLDVLGEPSWLPRECWLSVIPSLLQLSRGHHGLVLHDVQNSAHPGRIHGQAIANAPEGNQCSKSQQQWQPSLYPASWDWPVTTPAWWAMLLMQH